MSDILNINVAKLYVDAKLPSRKNPSDAGMDFFTYNTVIILPNEPTVVGTGVTVQVPEGYMLLLKPKGRSEFLIGSGVVDAFYEPGEIMVRIINTKNQPLYLYKGDAIVQGILIPVETPAITEVSLDEVGNKSARSKKGGIHGTQTNK